MLHFRNHLVLIGIWVFLALMMTGVKGRFFGMHYLLLTPEYRGYVDFWSFFATGLAFGWFFMTWNLTTYLLVANRFPFLATLSAPFTKFCLNNALIPTLFLAVYLAATIWFQWHDEFSKTLQIITNVLGFLTGLLVLVLILSGYFFYTNKDIFSFLHIGKVAPPEGGKLFIPGHRIPTLREIRAGATNWRVDTYLNERFRPRLVRSVAHYDHNMLYRVFHQNHLNAVFVQGLALLFLMILGFFMDSEWCRIPTGASVFILFSLVMAFFGAITFWFRTWGLLVFLCILGALNFITGRGYFHDRNKAYGLDYQASSQAEYTYSALKKIARSDKAAEDQAHMIKILDRWLLRNKTREIPKPKMIFLCVSGGGLRSALWTMQCLQQINPRTGGRLTGQSMLISGASGGMLGAAYYRELYYRQQYGGKQNPKIDASDPAHIEQLGLDLLNPVSFGIVASDLFFPLSKFKYGGFRYNKDRGYLFEKQFNENLDGILNKTIGSYYLPETEARMPLMFLTPYLINDGRQLVITPHPVRYMMQAPDPGGKLEVGVDAVDFRALLAGHNADSLSFLSALRMNCTYPYILPNVWLPTLPAVEVMDAGFRDNYGILTAARFIHVFKDWIRENTGGVAIVEIRCWEKVHPIEKSDSKGILDNMITPATVAGNITSVQDFDSDNILSMLDGLLGENMVEVVPFLYRPVRKRAEASMNLHLSKREKQDIEKAFYTAENQFSLAHLIEFLNN